MSDHRFQLNALSEEHQIALEHYRQHAGRTQERLPAPLSNGQRLATQAKGIYKPEHWRYALMIRVELDSPYKDGEFHELENGGWIVSYHQEDERRAGRSSESLFTNTALTACLTDRVPIGVLQRIRTDNPPHSPYLYRGLGGVIEKIGDYFIVADLGSAANQTKAELIQRFFRHVAEANIHMSDTQTLSNLRDAGELSFSGILRVYTEIVRRQGQGKFRKEVLAAYSGQCCISGTSSSWVLDAAHIEPYGGPSTNLVSNGLLLRTDLHNLFDLALLGIEPHSYKVRFSPLVDESQYLQFEGKQLRVPHNRVDYPEQSRLESRWSKFLASQSA